METDSPTICQLTENELDVVRQKMIPHKYSYFAIHFTDISFLPNILSQGIRYAQSTFDSVECVKAIKGKEYSEALGTYRYFYESVYGKEYGEGLKRDRIETIRRCFTPQSHFMRLLEKTNLRTSSELETIRKYNENHFMINEKLDFLEETDVNVLYELVARVFARNNYFTFCSGDYDDFQSAMNVALLFGEDSIYNKTNVFGFSNVYKRSSVIQVKPNSKIEGIMIYEANLNETLQIVLDNSKTINDIMPICDYDGDVLWPNAKFLQK
jgi:hypothetical protein